MARQAQARHSRQRSYPWRSLIHAIHNSPLVIYMNETQVSASFERYREAGQIEFITFHPSYSYEEFVEGITVGMDNDSSVAGVPRYRLKAGIFKEICKRALAACIGMDLESVRDKTWRQVYESFRTIGIGI